MLLSSEKIARLWDVVGWTMVHFLWTGFVVMLLALVVRMLVRRRSAQTRYAAMLGCFAVLAVLPCVLIVLVANQGSMGPWPVSELSKLEPLPVEALGSMGTLPVENQTFSNELVYDFTAFDAEASPNTPTYDTAQGAMLQDSFAQVEINAAEIHTVDTIESTPTQQFITLLFNIAKPIIPWLPTVWLIGMPLTLAWLTTGLVGVERLRRTSQPITTGPIAAALDKAKRVIGVSRTVGLAVCDRLAEPVLVGFFWPLVLLPSAALTGWSPEEMEMVLLHELAHVRRWDNLVNLVQRLFEAVLFFHPAVWILSGWVRQEREHCCDSAVLRHSTSEPKDYAHTLISLAEMAQHGRRLSSPAVAAVSSHTAAGKLRNRIVEILHHLTDRNPSTLPLLYRQPSPR